MNAIRTAFAALVAAAAFASPALAAPIDESHAAFFRADRGQTQVAMMPGLSAPERKTPTSTRVMVADPTGMPAGTITVDTKTRHLYLSLGDGKAMQYGVGVGRKGFEWSGSAHIGRMAQWPDWTPPPAMLKRRPDLPKHMVGGINNPLGARAMYLFDGGRDMMFRIHGTNEPQSIGHAVSSGCIRMMNADVEDLYSRVKVGTRVIVK
jgi:lipoprotein-anchoring transpeptidase ErfK/SrfK